MKMQVRRMVKMQVGWNVNEDGSVMEDKGRCRYGRR